MSTKVTLKYRLSTDLQSSFHLYNDALDSFRAPEDSAEPPVYLCLEGVSVWLETMVHGGATVTVTIPRELARELGLIPAQGSPDSSAEADSGAPG